MKILIDGRIPKGQTDGVSTYLELLYLASQLMHDFEFTFLVMDSSDWYVNLPPPSKFTKFLSMPSTSRKSQELLAAFPVLEKYAKFLYQLLAPKQSVDKKLSRLLLSNGIGVYHSPIQDSPSVEVKSIYHPHDLQHLAFPSYFSPVTIRYRERRWKLLARRASAVIAGSEFMKSEFVRLWGISPLKISVLPAPIMLTPETEAPVFDFDYILYPANHYPHKNHRTLIRSFANLENQGLKLILTGSGPELESNKRFALEAGVADRVVFCGKLEKQALVSATKKALAVVIPSQYEAGSFPILEALAVGTPVVASRIPPFEEISHPNLNLFGDPIDCGRLVNALNETLSASRDSQVLGEKSHTQALSSFAERLAQVYVTLLAGDPT